MIEKYCALTDKYVHLGVKYISAVSSGDKLAEAVEHFIFYFSADTDKANAIYYQQLKSALRTYKDETKPKGPVNES